MTDKPTPTDAELKSMWQLHAADIGDDPITIRKPMAGQQVIIDFAQVGTAGPFPVVNGHVKLPGATMQDLARMLRPTYEAASGVGNNAFDHQTAADFLSGKTISDEAMRKFVQASRWAHDEKASLSAMLISVRGELASREAEIALLKKALLEAEAAPQQEAQEPVAYVHVPHFTVEGKVRPVVSFEKYQQDYADGIYSTRIPLYTAPKAAPGEPDGFGSAEHWKEKAQYWAGVAHRLRGEALRGEPVDGIVHPPAPQQEAQEPCPSCRNSDIYACTCTFPTSRNAAPQPAPAPLSDDTKRLDWLDRNIFSREMSDWDAKYGHGPDYNMWVVFSPKGVQGSARNIIDAALAAQRGNK